MKIRNGFVSNSSSTSFCIAGTYLSKEQVINGAGLSETADIDFSDFDSYAHHSQEFDDGAYFGLDIDEQGMDETRAQFIARATETIKKDFPHLENIIVDYIHDGWFDN